MLEVRETRLRFAHDKLREQLVDDLAPAALRTLHLDVACAIEELYANREDHVTALAHHWREAGQPAREAPYACEAGMLALRSGACAEAVRYLRRALELSQMTIAVPARSDARRRRSRRAILDPNADVDRGSQSFALGRIHGALSEAYFRLGDLKNSRDHAVRALTHFGQGVPSGRIAWTAAMLRQLLLRAVQRLTRVRARDPERARLVAARWHACSSG